MMDQARTVPDDFPTDGVELSCFLVVSDYARSLAFSRDVLGAMVVRELPGTLCVLNFRGSQILLSAPCGPRSDQQALRTSVIGELTMRVPNCSAAYYKEKARNFHEHTDHFGDREQQWFWLFADLETADPGLYRFRQHAPSRGAKR